MHQILTSQTDTDVPAWTECDDLFAFHADDAILIDIVLFAFHAILILKPALLERLHSRLQEKDGTQCFVFL